MWLGNIATLRALPPGVDAVVSLCRVDDGDLPVGVEQVDVRLIDDDGPDANPNLELVLTDTVRLIEQLRNEGHGVLVHCVAAQSRTPDRGSTLRRTQEGRQRQDGAAGGGLRLVGGLPKQRLSQGPTEIGNLMAVSEGASSSLGDHLVG